MPKGIIKIGGDVTPPGPPPSPPGPKGSGGFAPSPPSPPSPPGPSGPLGGGVTAAVNFAGQKVGYFKIDLNNTVTNMYGESLEKWYYPPVEVKCLIDRGALNYADTDYGPDPTQTITVSIPRNICEELSFLPETGDVVVDRDRYYEVSSVESQFFTAPGTPMTSQTANSVGNVLIYVLTSILTRMTKLNILPS